MKTTSDIYVNILSFSTMLKYTITEKYSNPVCISTEDTNYYIHTSSIDDNLEGPTILIYDVSDTLSFAYVECKLELVSKERIVIGFDLEERDDTKKFEPGYKLTSKFNVPFFVYDNDKTMEEVFKYIVSQFELKNRINFCSIL